MMHATIPGGTGPVVLLEALRRLVPERTQSDRRVDRHGHLQHLDGAWSIAAALERRVVDG
ncbi:MAG TPA: hypothetical protein VI094_06940 [Propionibacteriaceae bacterium]